MTPSVFPTYRQPDTISSQGFNSTHPLRPEQKRMQRNVHNIHHAQH
jgi:hypothetical protein